MQSQAYLRNMFRKFRKLSTGRLGSWTNKQPSPSNTTCVNFCRLPFEVLEIIFSYLTPIELLILKNLGDAGLAEMSLAYMTADFSKCNTVKEESLASYFTNDRVRNIRQINFNNLFFVYARVLEKYIVKCQNLRKLSIYECKLSYANVQMILSRCPHLEELYWTVLYKKMTSDSFSDSNEGKVVTFPSVKKLYLTVKKEGRAPHVKVAFDLISQCENATEIVINFSSFFMTSVPSTDNHLVFISNSKYLSCKSAFHSVLTPENKSLLNIKMNLNALEGKSVLVTFPLQPNFIADGCYEKAIDIFSDVLTHNSPFAQFLTREKDLSVVVPTLNPNSVRSLVLLVSDSYGPVMENLTQLSQALGNRLTNLSLHNVPNPAAVNLEDSSDVPWGETKQVKKLDSMEKIGHLKVWIISQKCVADIIYKFVLTSVNISVLNLSEMHFGVHFPFDLLHCLKNLKVISLPSCALKYLVPGSETEMQCMLLEFENFIRACTYVEKFSFIGCVMCGKGPKDESLAPIQHWKYLLHLKVMGVETLRRCSFLNGVAKHCRSLQSLEVVDVGNPAVCHYIPYVVQVMRADNKLTFLRLNQKSMATMSCLFWKALEQAKHLQGLCLHSGVITPISNKVVIDGIKKLPYLHLFHLWGRTICQNLPLMVRQVMTKNQIYYHQVHIDLQDGYQKQYTECCLTHLA